MSDEDNCYPFTSLETAVKHLTGVDEANLMIESPTGHRYNLFLVYGNSPGELICDYSYPRSGDEFEPIARAHYEEWEGKTQPKTTMGKQYPELFKSTID